MRELTQERNPTSVSNVGKPLLVLATCKYIKEVIQEKNPMYVSSVGKPLLNPVTFTYIKEVTLERNLTYVSSVGKPSLVVVPLEYMKRPMLERIPKHKMWEGLLIACPFYKKLLQCLVKQTSINIKL